MGKVAGELAEEAKGEREACAKVARPAGPVSIVVKVAGELAEEAKGERAACVRVARPAGPVSIVGKVAEEAKCVQVKAPAAEPLACREVACRRLIGGGTVGRDTCKDRSGE